jgi:beta-mannosidase
VQQLYVFPNRWFIRKEQSDFGWDWGPAFAPAGPWRPAYVVQHERKESVYVLNTDLDIHRKDQINHLPPDQSKPWVVNASIDYLGSMPQNPSMSIRIKDADTGEVLTSKSPDNVRVSGDSVTGHIIVDSNTPKLWWPTGMGNQNLYDVEITVSGSNKKTLANVTKRSGFRTIYLNRQNITDEQIAQGIAPGANWHFEVNGHEFYAKGSNIIPPDVFWPRVTEQRMTELFNAVIAGNQNMLRVWSSGTYFPDYIYDLADKMGILLWSEFQFSCALYPVNEEFLENVAGEVTYNVRRVNHHPSLALWAGGNEFENLQLPIAKRNAPPEEYYRLVGAYEKLHITLIMPLVYENSRSISYMPTSTNNGYLGIDLWGPVPMIERYHNVTEGHYYGDTDYYNYNTTESFDYTTYPVNRFANEFGFHSMPSLQTWRQAIEPSEFEFNSSVVMLRNHHQPPGSRDTRNFEASAIGMGEMTLGVQKYYPTPFKSDSVANFSSWCHATQLFQADFYQSQIQYYRRGSGMPERQLGSLYWQLEDIWQAPSWAGIEYGGRWKVLHYKMRDIYWPVIVSPFWNYTTGDVEVYVTSDLWESVSGTAKLQWLDLSGNPIPDNAGAPSSTKFEVGALNTTAIYTTNVSKLSLKDPKNAILLLSIEADGHLPNSDETTTFTHENYFHPVFPKDLALVDPEIELSFDSATGKYTVEAKSGVAVYTWLDYPGGVGGHFEDNAFVLVPGQKREIGFVEDNGTGGDWVGDVTVSSLWDLTRD